MASRPRKTLSMVPNCQPLEARLVLSGNSLSHIFDNIGRGIDHIGRQISHLGQHQNTADHAAVNHKVAYHAPTGAVVHYHHIVK